ncbi:methyl-accepting chemotaxis protein [Pseudomonas sp. D8002]|nr:MULTISPECIES: methyl-accepting chemotaxis protein [unclassified Pseudomonas]NWA91416.1 methyl-accepting chemotaxis protein [Pseudomonas sp. D8002]NWB20989.1 methyl-accepting chemotaxis protein [Pseudomonas sp. D4002]
MFSEMTFSTLLVFCACFVLVVVVSFYVCKYFLLAPFVDIVEALKNVAGAKVDLTLRLDNSCKGAAGDLAERFNDLVRRIHELVSGGQGGVGELKSSVLALKRNSNFTRESIDNQQIEIDSIASSVSELEASAEEVAVSARLAAEASADGVRGVGDALKTVIESCDAVKSLSGELSLACDVVTVLGKEISSISAVLKEIEGIAEQTNLLALNAAIEAARAGESGRGFAVVADEVRNLAKRTQNSTNEISNMMERLHSGAGKAVEVMVASKTLSRMSMERAHDSMVSIDRINSAIQLIGDMNSQIASASAQQKDVVGELGFSINRVAQQGHKVSEAAVDNDVYSSKIEFVADTLESNVSSFKV